MSASDAQLGWFLVMVLHQPTGMIVRYWIAYGSYSLKRTGWVSSMLTMTGDISSFDLISMNFLWPTYLVVYQDALYHIVSW